MPEQDLPTHPTEHVERAASHLVAAAVEMELALATVADHDPQYAAKLRQTWVHGLRTQADALAEVTPWVRRTVDWP